MKTMLSLLATVILLSCVSSASNNEKIKSAIKKHIENEGGTIENLEILSIDTISERVFINKSAAYFRYMLSVTKEDLYQWQLDSCNKAAAKASGNNSFGYFVQVSGIWRENGEIVNDRRPIPYLITKDMNVKLYYKIGDMNIDDLLNNK